MKFKKIIITFAIAFPILGFTHDLCPGIMPENDLWIGIGDKSNSNQMTEAQFNKVIDRIEEIYKPITTANKKKLKIKRLWKDGTVNAYALKFIDDLNINIFGGIARHLESTQDSLALVVCHELGHHIGGTPHTRTMLFQKMTSEGQADYWGAMKCLRKYFEKDDNVAIASKLDIPEIVKEKCQTSFHNENEIAICYRTSMAGMAMARLFNSVKPKPDVVLDFAKPDPKVAKVTLTTHPAYQCRLDTYFQAALCDKDTDLEISDKNPDTGFCNIAEGYTEGLRPLCWFNSKSFY